MRLTIEEIEAIARSVAAQYDALTVDAVLATHGNTDQVELLVTVSGCHHKPCVVMVNVLRTDRESMEQELRTQFRSALDEHRASVPR